MAKDPDDRYGTAGGLVRAAQRVMEGGKSTRVMPPGVVPAGPTEVPADRHANRHGRVWLLPTVIAVATALILGGVGVVMGLLTKEAGPRPLPPQVTGPARPAEISPRRRFAASYCSNPARGAGRARAFRLGHRLPTV
jgi:hypothetical protein